MSRPKHNGDRELDASRAENGKEQDANDPPMAVNETKQPPLQSARRL